MKEVYMIKHHFSGPENISINQLTVSDLQDIASALRIAENFVPRESTQILEAKIQAFLECIKEKR